MNTVFGALLLSPLNGDTSSPWPVVLLILAAAAAMTVLLLTRKRK